ncbi:MAG: hypothetical protein IJ461_07660 [Clostridia bacterium]|nr:hypothetical protein [Clostridia bacterium]
MKTLKYYQYFLGALTLFMATLFIYHALRIMPYTPEAVAAAWNEILPFLGLWLGAALAGVALSGLRPSKAAKPKAQGMAELKKPLPHLRGLRTGLFVAAIALTVLGVINGGLRDVLYKAITICTECIGLG